MDVKERIKVASSHMFLVLRFSQGGWPSSDGWPHIRSSQSHQWWAGQDLNLRPHAYQACALTN